MNTITRTDAVRILLERGHMDDILTGVDVIAELDLNSRKPGSGRRNMAINTPRGRYPNADEAGRAYGLHPTTIREHCRKRYDGWSYATGSEPPAPPTRTAGTACHSRGHRQGIR